MIYANAKAGTASLDPGAPGRSLRPLLDAIAERIPPPRGDAGAGLQVVVANLDSSDYLGRIAIGRIVNGRVALGDEIAVSKLDGNVDRTRVTKLYLFEGLQRVEVEAAAAGDIICLAGIDDITIGETITDPGDPRPIPPLHVDEPTVSMVLGVNTSPMAGRDGQYVTSRNLRDRLARELVGNVSLRVEDTESPEQVQVVGRGELQLSILVEMMRREGYEMQVARPQIVTRRDGGRVEEPVEELVIDVAEDYQGVVIAQLGTRRATMTKMVNHGSGRVRLEFRIPTRGLIGFRSQFLTDTRGTGILHHLFAGVGALARAHCGPPHRCPGGGPGGEGHRLRHLEPAGARRDLRSSRHRGLRGDGHRRERAPGRPRTSTSPRRRSSRTCGRRRPRRRCGWCPRGC